MVFDAAASFQGTCLKEHLIPGPDLTSSLVGVLTRFRKERIPFTADIEKMFYQVRVPPEHQSFLQFLWWPNGDTDMPLQAYQMTVHVFGAVSSPGCANFALRRAATDFKEISSEASDALLNDFYVDDLLKSCPTVEIASKLAGDMKQMCHVAGFNLTKFVAPEKWKEVLKDIPDENKAVSCSKVIDAEVSVGRALGVNWCLESDLLGVRMEFQDTPLTRRGILSTVASIFDPLGFAAPFLLKGRLLLQEITRDGNGWDDSLSERQIMTWRKWREDVKYLSDIAVPRSFTVSDEKIVHRSIHCFSDASELGYGAAIYLKTGYESGLVDIALAMGKSRVAPTKRVTMPRLELVAAKLSTSLSHLFVSAMRSERERATNVLLD